VAENAEGQRRNQRDIHHGGTDTEKAKIKGKTREHGGGGDHGGAGWRDVGAGAGAAARRGKVRA
jgi:hypothetical protein